MKSDAGGRVEHARLKHRHNLELKTEKSFFDNFKFLFVTFTFSLLIFNLND